MEEGDHTITVYLYDYLGRTPASDSQTFTIQPLEVFEICESYIDPVQVVLGIATKVTLNVVDTQVTTSFVSQPVEIIVDSAQSNQINHALRYANIVEYRKQLPQTIVADIDTGASDNPNFEFRTEVELGDMNVVWVFPAGGYKQESVFITSVSTSEESYMPYRNSKVVSSVACQTSYSYLIERSDASVSFDVVATQDAVSQKFIGGSIKGDTTIITAVNKSTVNTDQYEMMFSGIVMHPRNSYIKEDVVCIIDSGEASSDLSVERLVSKVDIQTTQFNDFRGFVVETCVIVVDANENI